ncbi:ribonuclease H-like domain-containing protein [Tanacetum coccineum]|uniref:Ribonuclease H-like domain-containing protein n=1 Tax=Tanacetum coccineum TaxID=301880 RepID=A0ABQ5ACE8_9ASTR
MGIGFPGDMSLGKALKCCWENPDCCSGRGVFRHAKEKNDVKARTTLLLALPDEHQLRFSKYETTKELWEAILRTFGGNEATKKTKKNLLKQQYGNFKAEGSETLEQTFNRLQAIVSQLEFLDVPVEQEDLNQKFLKSLSPEWLMHTIVWRNRNGLDTVSLDDLYNHLKVYESEVQKKGGSSSQNMAFISSSNTNSGKSEVPTAQSFSTASGQVTTASTEIDDDDIEEMDIKWNMNVLSMRADRFWKRTESVEHQGVRTEVEERATRRSQSFMAEENEASENQALVAEEDVPTEFALMAMSSSSSDNEVYNDSYCSKSCKKNTENPTTKISKLREELFDSESDLCNYKRGLSQVEARLVEFKINKSKFYEKIRVLERDLELKDYEIENLTNELEEVKKERDGIDSKLEKFVNSSKDLDQMLESQKSGKDKKGMGFDEYRAVPPPPAQVYSSPMPDLSWTGLPEFADNTVTDYTRPTPSIDVTNDVRSELDGNNLTACKHGGTSSNAVSKPIINFVKESGCPNVIKINNIENARKPTAKYAELYRNITQSSNVRSNNFGPPIIEDWDSEDESDTESTPIESIRSTINQNRDQPRGNQRNWNNLKSQQLGKDFVMQNKACYKCGSFEHLKVNCKPLDNIDDKGFLDRGFYKKSGEIVIDSPQKEQEEVHTDKDVFEQVENEVNEEVPGRRIEILTAQSISNVVSSENRVEDFFGDSTHATRLNEVEANLSNMETTIQVSPTPTLKDPREIHPKNRDNWWLKDILRKGIDCEKSLHSVGKDEAISLLVFKILRFPHKVYKVVKAMYGLHQAPRAWYGTLSKYLLDNGFQRGTIDQTLFIRKQKGEFLLVQVYVDDIIFGSSNPKLCREFEGCSFHTIQMSAMV